MSNRMPGEIKDPDTGKIVYKEIWYKVRAAFAVLLSLAVLLWLLLQRRADRRAAASAQRPAPRHAR